MDLATFRTTFPELRTAPDALVERFLVVAARSIDTVVYGAQFDDAHGYLTAHLLALSPFGKNARLSSDSGTSTYGERYDEIRLQVTPSIMVV